ncbi:MAG: 2,3-bisphosphoglycerate-dependent phosphoglycerate mutase [Bryobacteraceae bacterium]
MRVVLIRHGESIWNAQNRFTGWTDIDLSDSGHAQARAAAQTLEELGFLPDRVFTSHLKRSIRTAWTILDQLDRLWAPTHSLAALNERCFGDFEGLTKDQVRDRFGPAALTAFRAQPDWRPPGDRAESLADLIDRVRPVWIDCIQPAVRSGENVLVSVHGNTIRALDAIIRPAGQDAIDPDVPPAKPFVYSIA